MYESTKRAIGHYFESAENEDDPTGFECKTSLLEQMGFSTKVSENNVKLPYYRTYIVKWVGNLDAGCSTTERPAAGERPEVVGAEQPQEQRLPPLPNTLRRRTPRRVREAESAAENT